MIGLKPTGMEFLCGAVHDIGKLVLAELYPAKTVAVWMRAYEQNRPLVEIEHEYFGVDHAQIGQEWLHRHKFQPVVRYVTAFHEDPSACLAALAKSKKINLLSLVSGSSSDDETNQLVHLIACANILA
jgi:HD-like signal output (HDOD) protein